MTDTSSRIVPDNNLETQIYDNNHVNPNYAIESQIKLNENIQIPILGERLQYDYMVKFPLNEKQEIMHIPYVGYIGIGVVLICTCIYTFCSTLFGGKIRYLNSNLFM